ncbi:hypothetical protein WN51_13978 [Melipona quadrifasciata]|uniref:Uncharacterized protein n=1 Tax=Melipona quadrifasciata TaxID=166423 RepID=A0A0M8ZYU7_9HYME|nr:hypothetical protein WN51_13978 [Melipona quadrifasciata]
MHADIKLCAVNQTRTDCLILIGSDYFENRDAPKGDRINRVERGGRTGQSFNAENEPSIMRKAGGNWHRYTFELFPFISIISWALQFKFRPSIPTSTVLRNQMPPIQSKNTCYVLMNRKSLTKTIWMPLIYLLIFQQIQCIPLTMQNDNLVSSSTLTPTLLILQNTNAPVLRKKFSDSPNFPVGSNCETQTEQYTEFSIRQIPHDSRDSTQREMIF